MLEVLEGRRKPAEEEAASISNDGDDSVDILRSESDSSSEGSPWEMSDSEDSHELELQGVQNIQVGAFILRWDNFD